MILADEVSGCPVFLVAGIIGSKWAIPLLQELSLGSRRTGQLRKDLIGISPKVLAERLREFEALGLLSRIAYAEIPPRVEYSITESGRRLHDVLLTLKDLGLDWQRRLAAGSTYDVETKLCKNCLVGPVSCGCILVKHAKAVGRVVYGKGRSSESGKLA